MRPGGRIRLLLVGAMLGSFPGCSPDATRPDPLPSPPAPATSDLYLGGFAAIIQARPAHPGQFLVLTSVDRYTVHDPERDLPSHEVGPGEPVAFNRVAGTYLTFSPPDSLTTPPEHNWLALHAATDGRVLARAPVPFYSATAALSDGGEARILTSTWDTVTVAEVDWAAGQAVPLLSVDRVNDEGVLGRSTLSSAGRRLYLAWSGHPPLLEEIDLASGHRDTFLVSGTTPRLSPNDEEIALQERDAVLLVDRATGRVDTLDVAGDSIRDLWWSGDDLHLESDRVIFRVQRVDGDFVVTPVDSLTQGSRGIIDGSGGVPLRSVNTPATRASQIEVGTGARITVRSERTLPGSARGAAWRPDGEAYAIAMTGSPNRGVWIVEGSHAVHYPLQSPISADVVWLGDRLYWVYGCDRARAWTPGFSEPEEIELDLGARCGSMRGIQSLDGDLLAFVDDRGGSGQLAIRASIETGEVRIAYGTSRWILDRVPPGCSLATLLGVDDAYLTNGYPLGLTVEGPGIQPLHTGYDVVSRSFLGTGGRFLLGASGDGVRAYDLFTIFEGAEP